GDLLTGRFDRRAFLKAAGGAGLVAAFPFVALGAEGNYEAMVLSCIDPRFPELTLNYMKGRGMLGKYSQFVIAGASIGVVAPAFQDWHKAFWDNLAASIQLHQHPQGHRARPSRLRRRQNRLWSRESGQSGGGNRNASRRTDGIPPADGRAPTQARGGDRPHGA